MLSRLRLAAPIPLVFATCASAQTYHDLSGTVPLPVVPLVNCSPTGPCAGPISATNPLPVSGVFSASLSGFAPAGAYASPLSATTTSSRIALPSGQVVVVYNVGANAAFVQLGGASVSANSANDVVQPNSWMAFAVGANTYLAAVTTSGVTTLNLSGGSGLPTGSGGGGGGGGGASIPSGTAGSPNAAVVTIQGVAGGTPAPVTVSSLPSLPSGANTVGAISNSAFGISGTLPSFTATPTVNAAQSGAWNVGNISGTITLPTGAANAANQTSVESSAGGSAASAVTIQGNAGGVPVPVSGSLAITTYDSGAIRVSTTPGSSAHAAGTSIGGLLSIPVARVNGGSGIITSAMVWTSWGSTQTYILRVWQKNPTSTTCADGSNFASSGTDDANLIGPGPISLLLAAPANSTGDAKSYAYLAPLSWDYKNADGTPTQNVYACLITNGSDTPGSTATLSVSMSGPQN